MNYNINPFQQLYFSDDVSETDFVQFFSPIPLQTAINPLFQGGNVVLSGTQGCGKTMILCLFDPKTRKAYKEADVPFPVHESMSRFLSAGVNLTRSAITDIGQVTTGGGDERDLRELPYYFADFFNYWVIKDLLETVKMMQAEPEVFDHIVNGKHVGAFVECLVKQDCWFGVLDGCETFEDVENRVAERVSLYRKWVSLNTGEYEVPSALKETKTAIGEPIARMAECLRRSRMITQATPVFIRVDQIEELHRARNPYQRKVLLSFRRILNRAFANRDMRVHYRIGTRRYGWSEPECLRIHGSEAFLEKRRDYLLIQMDEELFRRRENERSRWLFDLFAEDAFRRRVEFYLKPTHSLPKNLPEAVFGKSPKPEKRWERFVRLTQDPAQIDRALGIDSTREAGKWSSEWREFLHALFESNSPMDAVLAAAWGRQTGGSHSKIEHRESPPPKDAPWKTRKWWRKEREGQAILQLATRRQQRLLWWGYGDMLGLSGGNITAFFSECHRVWDLFLREESSKPEAKRIDLLAGGMIPWNTQAAGIQYASSDWLQKLREEVGGDIRKRFVEALGSRLNRRMLEDIEMRYPGANGFSLVEAPIMGTEEPVLQKPARKKGEKRRKYTDAELGAFLREAVGFGALVIAEHTPKTKSSARRVKFYLNPILSPVFQLPEIHTKEPLYWTMNELESLAEEACIPKESTEKPTQQPSNSQLDFFPPGSHSKK